MSFIGYNASTQTVSIETEHLGITPNVYYKDINNVLNGYVGSWKYETGNDLLLITFTKLVHHYDANFNNYTDYLIGEYKYIENGIEVVNTLNSLSDPAINYLNHNIGGNLILFSSPVGEFVDGKKSEVWVHFYDPIRPYIEAKAYLDLFVGTNEFIRLKLRPDGLRLPTPGATAKLRVPFGDYILTRL